MVSEPTMSVLAALLFINSVSSQCLTGSINMPMNPEVQQSLPDARISFAVDSLKKASLLESRDNIFFSPHSLHNALMLAYFGARGTTETALRKALHIPDSLSKTDIQKYYAFEKTMKYLSNSQNNTTVNYEFTTANRLWITDTRRLNECMLDLFGDQLERTDFHTNPTAVREQINDWVSNTTKGQIRDLLPADSITEDTDLVLANAVYFKGLWQSRFDPADSQKDIFYAPGSQNSVTTFMRQKKSFNHMVSEELGAHVLELPYKGNQVSMFILLPPFASARSIEGPVSDRGVRHVIEKISTEAGQVELQELLDGSMTPREVEVSLPKFTLERELPVNELLRSMGAGEIFAPGVANLQGFVADGEAGLHLGDAVHRARIEVTEEGTTAAAATALFSFRSSRPSEPALFNANHPFVYFIYEKPTRTVMFSGIFRTPSTPGQQ